MPDAFSAVTTTSTPDSTGIYGGRIVYTNPASGSVDLGDVVLVQRHVLHARRTARRQLRHLQRRATRRRGTCSLRPARS